MKPRIGVLLDWQEAGGYAPSRPWYALRTCYFNLLANIGCVSFGLGYQESCIEDTLDSLDGLVLTGSDWDIDPALYGDKKRHETVQLNPTRTVFEMDLARKAIDRQMPIFGICAGQQLLNVLLGGSLIQHIPDEVPGALAHHQPTPPDQPGHLVDIVPGTKLAAAMKALQVPVNTKHHQAVKEVGKGCIVNARASDGVIEGIELQDHPFCIGVEWHPEFLVAEAEQNLWNAFRDAALAYQVKQKQKAAG